MPPPMTTAQSPGFAPDCDTARAATATGSTSAVWSTVAPSGILNADVAGILAYSAKAPVIFPPDVNSRFVQRL